MTGPESVRQLLAPARTRGVQVVATCLLALGTAQAAHATGLSLRDPYCRHATTQYRARSTFLGINDIELGGSDSVYQSCTAGWYAAAHLGLYRAPLLWSTVQPKPGPYNWSTYDREMMALARHHVRWLPVLIQAPPFGAALGVTSVPLKGLSPPKSASAFARFVAAAVERYGAHGSFWRDNPGVPRMPVRAWQIWNEPNLSTYWVPQPSPRAYLRLLRASYRAIHHLDVHDEVLGAGLPYNSPEISAGRFLRDILRAGASRYMTAVALHPYARTPADAARRVTAIRLLMNRYGARHLPLWLTEFGWADTGPHSPYTTSGSAAQQHYIASFVRVMAERRRGLKLRALLYYCWRDRPPLDGKYDFFGLHTGLLRLNGSAKPALTAVAALANRLNR